MHSSSDLADTVRVYHEAAQEWRAAEAEYEQHGPPVPARGDAADEAERAARATAFAVLGDKLAKMYTAFTRLQSAVQAGTH